MFQRNHNVFRKVQNTHADSLLLNFHRFFGNMPYLHFDVFFFILSIVLTYFCLFSADKQLNMSILSEFCVALFRISQNFASNRPNSPKKWWPVPNFEFRGGEFTGIMDCWRSTVRNHGFLALYAGMVPNLVGEVVYRGLKYCLYDFIQVMKIYLI